MRPDYNWVPGSFEEFRDAAWQGRVQLGILDKQYPWLYNNALPFSTFKKYKYETRLLRRMAEDRDLFQRVHNHGIDLILHPTEIKPYEFHSDYRGEYLFHVVFTLAALFAGVWLWSEGWHWSIMYLLPAVGFALAGSVINSFKDERDQESGKIRCLEAAVWPLLLIGYLASRPRK